MRSRFFRRQTGLSRREFFQGGSGAIAAISVGTLLGSKLFGAEPQRLYRAAVIGRSGGGDYGHGLDVIFKGMKQVSLEAIADADAEGLKKAAERSGAKRQYQDFREMLQKEKPDIVSIAPRQPDCHKEMALAAIAQGASILMEKPMVENLEEADEIVRAAEEKGVKVAVSHTRRFTPEFVRIKRLLDEGFLGTVLEIRAQGKQDSRAGGEDMIVLGSHDFDIMRYYFGDPAWCFGSVTQAGRDIGRGDIHRGHEPMRVAGDCIRATFAFPKNVEGYWNSVKAGGRWNSPGPGRERWGFTILGTNRVIAYQSGFGTAYLDSPELAHKTDDAVWKELPDPRNWPVNEFERHPVVNLIHAIESNSEPLCSGKDGRWAVEMVAAVYESQRVHGRVELPLKTRENPLTRF